MKKNKDKKIQKIAQKILDFDSKYPLNDLPLNYNYVGIILFWIVALCSLWISVIFERKLA